MLDYFQEILMSQTIYVVFVRHFHAISPIFIIFSGKIHVNSKLSRRCFVFNGDLMKILLTTCLFSYSTGTLTKSIKLDRFESVCLRKNMSQIARVFFFFWSMEFLSVVISLGKISCVKLHSLADHSGNH